MNDDNVCFYSLTGFTVDAVIPVTDNNRVRTFVIVHCNTLFRIFEFANGDCVTMHSFLHVGPMSKNLVQVQDYAKSELTKWINENIKLAA